MSDLDVTQLVEELTEIGMTPVVVDETTFETPSPFIEGTEFQWAWDATYLEYAKRCPQLYKFKKDGWTTKDENIHLRWGQEMHDCFHDYELLRADGIEHDEAVFHTIRELLYRTEDWHPEHKYKNKEFLIRTVIRKLDKYQHDPAKTLKLANGKPAAEVSFNFELDYGPMGTQQPYVLCGHLDRVVDYNDEIFFEDYKSSTTTPSEWYWNQFHPHNQMSLYTIASKVVFQTNIKGGIIHSAQLMMDDTRFTRGFTYRTEAEMTEWLVDLKYWIGQAHKWATDGYWPKNDTACDKYGGCKFREICNKDPGVRDKFLKSNFIKGEPWNPLKPR